MLSSINKQANRFYICYKYWTPIPVLTKTETIIFNSIILSLVAFLIYWIISVLPPIIVRSIENVYYYTTGDLLSFKVIIPCILSKNIWSKYDTIRSSSLRHTNTITTNNSSTNRYLRSRKDDLRLGSVKSTFVKYFD